jgi:putative transposase
MPALPEESRHPSNPSLRRLIQSKKVYGYPLNKEAQEAGFRGWHERGYLPHYDVPNVTQLVTLNLADAFPVKRHTEWEVYLRLPDKSEARRRLETWLDHGMGDCWLRQSKVAAVVEAELLSRHHKEYELRAWIIMPNHCHIVVDVWEKPLSRLIKKWKGSTATAANRLLGRSGHFWQEDYWDTLIKGEKHLLQAIRYVENNPTKAKLVLDPKEWRWGSARRKDKYNRLAE